MTTPRTVGFVLITSAAVLLAQSPPVPKLPHVASGKTTNSGLDYKMPGPKEGLVPDKETAIKIAEVILFRLYGQENITTQKPYVVTQDENIWWVCGTLKEGMLGSSFKIAISQQTAAILYLEE
jgi:hypothetical protein